MRKHHRNKIFSFATLAVVVACCAAACNECDGQTACPTCPTGQCPKVTQNGGVVLAVDYTPSTRAAVRVRAGNSCGSGSVVGRYKTGSLVLTNAHVVGTRVGREVAIDAAVRGAKKTLSGRVVMAAYSDRTLTDWAVVYVADWQDIEPVKCSKEKPQGTHYTRGSPRCVWPLVTTDVRTVQVDDNSPLWRWTPNSIGGQSGSGVWSYRDHLQYGLLTWSWGGLGAGQQTAEIYRQARERTVDGTPRPPGLKIPDKVEDVVLETGFFVETDIDTLPIWFEGDDGGEGDGGCDLTPEDYQLFQELKAEAEAGGGDHREVIRAAIQLMKKARGK